MATVVLFDVNGTLLDLSVLDPHFGRRFGETGVSARIIREDWFSTMQRLWLTELVIGSYTPFETVAQTALHMTVEKWGVRSVTAKSDESVIDKVIHAATDTLGLSQLSPDESAILNQLKALPAFPDVVPGLGMLKQAGFRLAALTNGTGASAKTLLQETGLFDYFEEVISVEDVKRYKPARQAYELAASRLHVNLDFILLVAAHDWDIAGANAAGCQTAFLQRPGKVLNPRGPKPNATADSLTELAEKIIHQSGR